MKIGFQKKLVFKITTPEIICNLFSFLDKDQIERIQLVNRFWNNVITCHKNILPLRQFDRIYFNSNRFYFYATEEELSKNLVSYKIKFDGTNLIKRKVSSRYSQLTVDEVLTNLNDVVFYSIDIYLCDTGDRLYRLLNMMKLVTTKTGGRFLGRIGNCESGRFDSKLDEIFDNYIIVDELILYDSDLSDSYIREICANPEIVQLFSTPKEIIIGLLQFKENEEVLHFTCNGKLNGANRLTILFDTSETNYENFIRQWFELYHTHENPISLVGKFELRLTVRNYYYANWVLDAVKTFLYNIQVRVKCSLERFHSSFYDFTNQYLKRRCVLHETDSYALVIEMAYEVGTDMSSINALNLDQPPCDQMKWISLCVKSL